MYRVEHGISLTESSNLVKGVYSCKSYDNPTNNYSTILYLNSDNTFKYGPYDNLDNNYAKGTYTFNKSEKTVFTSDLNYYSVTFNGTKDDLVVNGIPSNEDFNIQMELGLGKIDGKKGAVIVFTSSYNMYYCDIK